jgi:hypothetical protein
MTSVQAKRVMYLSLTLQLSSQKDSRPEISYGWKNAPGHQEAQTRFTVTQALLGPAVL